MRELTITRVNNVYWVQQWEEWMMLPLTGKVTRYEMVEDPKTGKREKKKKVYAEPCYTRDEVTGETMFAAGLLSEFIDEAKKHGITVIAQDKRDPNPMLLEPHRENIPEGLRHKQDETIEAIIAHDKGIVKCNTGFGKSYILRVMTKVYPKARILICTASKVVVEQIYRNLVDLLGKDEVGLVRGGTPDSEGNKRVVVSTCASLMRTDIQHCDFLFFDEVHNVGFNKVYEFIFQNVGHARMFGFTASLVRGDGALAAIKALFGEVIATCSYQEAVVHKMVTPIKVFMPEYRDSFSRKLTGIGIIDERRFYWDNLERNAFIGKVTLDAAPDEQTLITVKTIEHAVMLSQIPELKDFTVIHSGNIQPAAVNFVPYSYEEAPVELNVIDKLTKKEFVAKRSHQGDLGGFLLDNGEFMPFMAAVERLVLRDKPTTPVGKREVTPKMIGGVNLDKFKMSKKEVDQKLAKFASGELKKVIATTTIKEGGDFNHLSFMVRADGSSSGILSVQFPGRASRLCRDKEVSIVIDPFDVTNEWVRFRSIKRWKYYHQEGWL